MSHAELPDIDCTPGALNPNVKQSTIRKTVCVANWADTVPPPTSYTNKLEVFLQTASATARCGSLRRGERSETGRLPSSVTASSALRRGSAGRDTARAMSQENVELGAPMHRRRSTGATSTMPCGLLDEDVECVPRWLAEGSDHGTRYPPLEGEHVRVRPMTIEVVEAAAERQVDAEDGRSLRQSWRGAGERRADRQGALTCHAAGRTGRSCGSTDFRDEAEALEAAGLSE